MKGAVVVGTGGLLAACGVPAQSAGPSSSNAKGGIQATLGVVTGINAAEIYYAQSRDLFTKHGIDAKPVTFQSAVAMRDALIAGRIDLAAQAPFHVYLAQAKGIPLKIVGNRRNIVDVSLLAREEGAGTVKSVADLKGRSIAVAAIGAWDWAIVCQYLHKAGLDPTADVRFVATTNASSLLQAGQVDAGEGVAPQIYQMQDAKLGRLLVDPFDPATHQRMFGSRRVMSRAWLTHQRVVDASPKLIQGVLRATDDAFGAIRGGSPDELIPILKPYYPGVADSVLRRAITQDLKQAVPASSAMSQAAYEADQQIFINAGLVKTPIPFSSATITRWAGAEA